MEQRPNANPAAGEGPGSPEEPAHGGRGPLLAIVGPTAAGKTELSLRIADHLGAEIASLDSMLVYRGMDIGTAKPSLAERSQVPHHLIDLVEPTERYDVQHYLADAATVEAGASLRDRRTLYVGGTGLYLQALLFGLFEGPPVDLNLRREIEEEVGTLGGVEAHRLLEESDPSLASRLHPNDTKRIVRGLEVLRQTGKPLSEWQRQWSEEERPRRPARLVGLTQSPEVLRGRIEARVERMLVDGWIDEVRAIEAAGGLGPTAAQALGYGEVLAHLRGELDRTELAERIATRTWRFSRRQLTWYRRIPGIEWIDPGAPDAFSLALEVLHRAS